MGDPIDPLTAAGRAPEPSPRRVRVRRLGWMLGALPAALLAALSCNVLDVVEPGRTSEVRVTPDTIIMRIGALGLLRASALDSSNTLLPQRLPSWSSSAASVASVNDSGVVLAVGAGVASIRAVVGSVEGAAVVIVSGDPVAVSAAAGNGQVAGVNETVAIAPTVRVVDAGGNAVYGVPVSFAVTSGGGTVEGAEPVLTDVDGLASKPWQLGPSPGPNTLTATAAGAGLTGNPVVFAATAEVGPPDPGTSSVVALPSIIPPSAGEVTATITVTVRDALGRTISGAAVTLAATGSGNTLTQPGTVTDNAGRVTGTLSSTGAGDKLVTATVNGVVVITEQATVTVNPGAPAAIAVVTEPGGAVSNVVFTAQPMIEIRDGFGNRLMDATDAVTVSLAEGNGLLASGTGSFTVNAVAGRATFAGLRVRGIRVTADTLGVGEHVLSFSVTGLAPVESAPFDVEVSYAYNVLDVFGRGCVGCHAEYATYGSVVNAPSTLGICAPRVRVVAGDSTSLMYEKMKAGPACGSSMPFGPLLSPRQRLIVRDWIMQGARNN